MNTREIIRERRDLTVAQPMAVRAVAICEGCPLAKFCATKTVTPCESSEVRAQHVESTGGEYSSGGLDKPIEFSYRKQLMDDTIPFVMANLQKRKEQRPLLLKPLPRTTPTPKFTVPQPRPKPVPVAPPPKPRNSEIARGGSADIIADILVSMMGVGSLSTVRDKKRV